jgi:hypothetical protein
MTELAAHLVDPMIGPAVWPRGAQVRKVGISRKPDSSIWTKPLTRYR